MTVLPPGTFYRWMQRSGRLGDQHKVPRVTNDRVVAGALLAEAGGEIRHVPSDHASRYEAVAKT
jgi:hypothetical protein